jgi:hypothetical protein
MKTHYLFNNGGFLENEGNGDINNKEFPVYFHQFSSKKNISKTKNYRNSPASGAKFLANL